MNVIIMGMAFVRLTDPDLPDDVLELVFDLVWGGLSAKASGQA